MAKQRVIWDISVLTQHFEEPQPGDRLPRPKPGCPYASTQRANTTTWMVPSLSDGPAQRPATAEAILWMLVFGTQPPRVGACNRKHLHRTIDQLPYEAVLEDEEEDEEVTLCAIRQIIREEVADALRAYIKQ